MKRSLAVLTMVLSCLWAASAQMIIGKKVGNTTVMCMQSGLYSDVNDCGVRSDWYSYAFVGSISTITPVEKDEQELQIIPEEVFNGKPATPLTVLTSQALCLPNLAVGDRWLFFLHSEKDKPIVLDYYGNASLPIANAEKQIETLRRLQNIGEFGILRGGVVQGGFFDGKPVPGARVFAQRQFREFQSVAITDADGRFEFQPLPPGEYKITTDLIGSQQTDDANILVRAGGCWNITLSRSPKAEISGHVHHYDGSSVPNAGVMLIDANGYLTTHTDASGNFSFNSLIPGDYVVGINLPGAPAWKHESCGGVCEVPLASMYYGGSRDRSGAIVIRLTADEKRSNLDFIAPAQ